MDAILAHNETPPEVPNLLVGNDKRDDAAVMDLGDGTAIVSTTDFFMPIVDDAHDFGRIASVNSISDVYAMGGQPILAIAILGWPVKKLPPELAHDVIEGARLACKEAGIPLAGGHSIDNPEPIFGLAVTGRLPVAHLKRNSDARAGDLIYLTKPLGLGVLNTAQKQCKLLPEHADLARNVMIQLNKIGAALGPHEWVTALTDITGFGLLGHLGEVCEASLVSAELVYDKIPLLDPTAIDEYIKAGCVPGGTDRNWHSFGEHIAPLDEHRRKILCDPQTSGGLLVAVDPAHEADFCSVAEQHDMQLEPIGKFIELAEHRIRVV